MERLEILGIGVICLGILIFVGYALYGFIGLFLSANVNPVIKVGIVSIIIGVIVILISP